MKPAPRVHPIAELLPSMKPDELQALLVDIKANGLRAPIVMFEGMILDGRHRSAMWFALHNNHDVPSTTFEGTHAEAVALVRSNNVKRRHLKPSQIAAFEAAAEAFLKPTNKGGRSTGTNSDQLGQRAIAKQAGVSRDTIVKAAKVLTNGHPIVQQQMRAGKVSVERALAVSKLPKDRQLGALDGTIKLPPTPTDKHFNRGVEAAAALVVHEGNDALAARIRALRKGVAGDDQDRRDLDHHAYGAGVQYDHVYAVPDLANSKTSAGIPQENEVSVADIANRKRQTSAATRKVKKECFEYLRRFRTRHGARRLFEVLRRDYGADAVYAAVVKARTDAPRDPVSYIKAELRPGARRRLRRSKKAPQVAAVTSDGDRQPKALEVRP